MVDLNNFMTEHKFNESSSQRRADVINAASLVVYFYSATVCNFGRNF